ncbi:tetratricopeptide repeat protein [Antarcticibacterium sp. 1MA-6-2]|uniref:tetratricopeptide repeat protein n=1 Tax=Antarcticibacterium sp. 1MA-6-2 TaxID=2908210 RepID=UPI001F3DB598|nr:tetratricopeptide repeat protein [Antarcticibacterium sp. 1MA-6-2]UJH90264.1 tetratricopeptide repeat protein [Antarcticibacterium sp. 1MA-6-2]
MRNNTYLKDLQVFLMLPGFFFFLNSVSAQSLQQEDKKIERETNTLMRDAEDHLSENDFSSAEASYREAVAKNYESVKARYNMANMYYGKEKPAQAVSRLEQAAKVAEAKEDKHKIFHNMGNSFMEQKKYKEAVDAYKNALRNNPNDEETRYNLALAKQKLEKEDPQGGGGDDKKDEEEKNEDEKNKGDQGEQEKDKQEGEDKEDKGGEKKEDPKQEPEKPDDKGEPKEQKEDGEPQQPQQPQPGQLSPQQIKSLLEAMNNEEKKVQDKVNAEKVKGAKVRTEKDW